MSSFQAQRNCNAANGYIEAKSVSYLPPDGVSEFPVKRSSQRSRSRSHAQRQHHAEDKQGRELRSHSRMQHYAEDKELRESLEERSAATRKALEESLCTETRQALQSLVNTGLVKEGEFDLRSCTVLASLPLSLQRQVMAYLEDEKVFLANARSKSGFLVAACEKAKQGMIDARGFIGKDPWREYLLKIAQPRTPQIELVSEKQWLDVHGQEPAKLLIDVSSHADIGTSVVSLLVNLNQSCETVKNRLAVIGVRLPVHKMRLKSVHGFLKDTKTLAFYNLQSGSELKLLGKSRGGVASKKDQSDGYDPAFCDGLTSSALSI